MPSEKHRSKEDTWTTDELNRALKREDGRRHRDRDESRRKERQREEVNGDSRRRKDDDERRHHKDRDEDRRSHREDGRRERNDSGDRERLTEEERERQRRERREKREGKSKGEDSKKPREYDSRKQKLIIDDDEDNRDRRKSKDDDRRREEERDRRRQQRETEDKRQRHRGEEDRDKRKHRDEVDGDRRKHKVDDEEKESRHKRDYDRDRRHQDKDDERKREEERERRRREREGDSNKRRPVKEEDRDRRHRDKEEDRERRRHDKEEDRERRHRGRDDDDRERGHRGRDDDDREKRRHRKDEADEGIADIDEDERERQRRERREKRDGKDKDSRKREEEEHRRQKEQEREERKAREREEEERRSHYRSGERAKSSRYGRYGRGGKPKEESEDEYNYDDDFEDYEEDFEEDDEDPQPSKGGRKMSLGTLQKSPRKPGTMLDYENSEMNDLLKALDKENERLLEEARSGSGKHRYREETSKTHNDRRRYSNSDEDEQEQPKVSRSRTMINFLGAKKHAITSQSNSIMGKRAQDLLQMVSLDTSEYDMFDMPPVKEYDLYIRSFGRSDTTQAYVQTGDDDIEREIQTDEIDSRQKWTQHPPEDFAGCGRGDGEKDIEEEEESVMNKQQDLSRLSKFVQRACQVVSILLEEDEDLTRTDVNANKSNIGLSEGYTQLSMLSILKGRYVEFAQFSPTQPNLLITAYSKPREGDESISVGGKGIVCVWNTNDPKYPHRILACESQPTCCCFSPYKPSLAFAGMVDGSICVWDLREPSSLHKSVSHDNTDYVLRMPTYNTASVLETENHHSPVTTLNPVAAYSMSDPKHTDSQEESGAGLSFQLVSCEEQGILNFWVVAVVTNPDMAGSEADLGMSPGGRIKLVHSSCIPLRHPSRFKKAGDSFRVFDMQLAPTDPNHLYIGTDLGYVLHCLRFGNRAFPSYYSTNSDVPVDVNSLDFSPFGHQCFLVSCNDGTVHLYSTTSDSPLVTWPAKIWDSNKLICVRWSRSRPCVFFVLDCNSRLYTFDMLEGDAMPVKIDNLSHDQVMHLTFSSDNKSHSRPPQMLVSLATGHTQIHTIAKEYREEQTLENDFLPSFLQRY